MAFLKKEWMEAVRTYKVLLLLLIFLVLGIMNPLTAKLLPDIIQEFMPEGMSMTIKAPGAVDSWTQFYKNVPQMGYMVVIILFSGGVAGELGKGTLLPLLAKGLGRDAVLYAKYTVEALLWTLGYMLSVFVSTAYTVYFWPKDHMEHMILSFGMVWLFGMLLLAILLVMGVMTKRVLGALLGTGTVVVLFFLVQMIPRAEKYNPITLCSKNMEFLLGKSNPAEYIPAVIVTLLVIVICLVASCSIFKRESVA